MNTERVLEAIRSQGITTTQLEDRKAWSDVMSHPDIRDYLNCCVTTEGFDASGVGVLGVSRLREENAPLTCPGGKLREYGYVTIAVTVGGNAIVLSSYDGDVYWADHSFFSDDEQISYEDRASGEWYYLAWSQENVRKALVQLSDSVDQFLLDLIAGRFTDRLDELDLL